MPYHVSVTTVASQQHYRVVVVDELDGTTALNLGEWLDAARLNPGARFEIDLSESRWVDPRAMDRLMRRHDALHAEGRLEVNGHGHHPYAVPSRLAVAAPAAVAVLEPLLTACA
jgi:hypothetical protein